MVSEDDLAPHPPKIQQELSFQEESKSCAILSFLYCVNNPMSSAVVLNLVDRLVEVSVVLFIGIFLDPATSLSLQQATQGHNDNGLSSNLRACG